MKLKLLLLLFFSPSVFFAQSGDIKGLLTDDQGAAIIYANVMLYSTDNTQLIKVETTDEAGKFLLKNIPEGNYNLLATYVGYADLKQADITVSSEETTDLGKLSLASSSVQLQTATVTAQRAMVEIKPDKTVFNVQGTINSVGDNGLGLLRKAPGVLVDNNNNVSVLGRSGVLFYVNGKRLPLQGDDLVNYLQNIPAEQIDRMDIITNPGARYEAEGNAGIIDIILKKDKNLGSNGTLSSSITQGRKTRGNVNLSTNYRNKGFNAFGTAGFNGGSFWNRIEFTNEQNNLFLDEFNELVNTNNTLNYRVGTDFFISKNQTLGFLVSGQVNDGSTDTQNEIAIATAANPSQIDSFLFANNMANSERNQNTYNVNYVFREGSTSLNIDLDYGRYRNDVEWSQPNLYFTDRSKTNALSSVITEYDTPVDIDIYTAKVDYEREAFSGKLGFGSKYSEVATNNQFNFFDIIDDNKVRNLRRSNTFDYSEKVIAGYISYARALNQKWNLSSGLRVEQTDSKGDLVAELPELQEEPVEQNYLNFFPNIGLTYQKDPMNVFGLSYGRRINRPDYNVLNPFRTQLSEITFERGNARLNPEIVNNLELNYTHAYRYNFKLGYSYTTNQITRLIGPDDVDPRASFISWDNLAEQTVWSFNISAPFTVKPWWNMFVNFNTSYTDNQADYSEVMGGIVDVQAYSYNIFQQSTFELGKGYKGEISGWFSGPGVWGGVFEYDPSWSLNLGLQKKYMDKLNVRLSIQDIFFQTGWSGTSNFNNQIGIGKGNWDSQTVGLSLSYDFGNNRVKTRSNRKTGIDQETKRLQSDGGGRN